MRQFNKLVAIEPVSLTEWGEDEINKIAKEVILYNDIPSDDDEIVSRIGDADAVLLSYTSQLTANAMKRCPNIKYVGMCCSLYSPESANVDLFRTLRKALGKREGLSLHDSQRSAGMERRGVLLPAGVPQPIQFNSRQD